MSPYADFPKTNRTSLEWGRETIEMQENGSTKNLLQMSDIYYSVRRSFVAQKKKKKSSNLLNLLKTRTNTSRLPVFSSARVTELRPGEKRPVPVHGTAGFPTLVHLPRPMEPVVRQRRLATERLFLRWTHRPLLCVRMEKSHLRRQSADVWDTLFFRAPRAVRAVMDDFKCTCVYLQTAHFCKLNRRVPFQPSCMFRLIYSQPKDYMCCCCCVNTECVFHVIVISIAWWKKRSADAGDIQAGMWIPVAGARWSMRVDIMFSHRWDGNDQPVWNGWWFLVF